MRKVKFRTKSGKVVNFNTKAKVFKPNNSKVSMARRKVSKRRAFSNFRRKRSSRSSSAGVKGIALGVGGYWAYKNYVAPKIPIAPETLSIAELVAGYLGYRKGGFIGDTSKVLFTFGLYNLANQIMSGQGIMSMTQSTGGQVYYG